MKKPVDPERYIHDEDRKAMKSLKAMPGFPLLVKWLIKVLGERQMQIINMSSFLKIGPDQLPEYYNMLPPVCETLGIEIPDLYLAMDTEPNAFTYGDTKPSIVITSGLLKYMPKELIPTILAHECGHIACHHVLYLTLAELIFGTAKGTLTSKTKVGHIATFPLEAALYYWVRRSELSADRAAVICDGTSRKMAEVCLRFAGLDNDIQAKGNLKAFMKQAKEYRRMIHTSKWNKTLEYLYLSKMTHPLMSVRALECWEWSKSDKFREIMAE